MSMFGKNTTSLGNYNAKAVVAREGYESSFGAALIMIESAINEEKFFAHLIMKDQGEAMAKVKGLAIDESVEVVTEGISEFAAGLKKMIMAAWEKIKGLWKSFIAKFDSVIMRDTKALFNKHKTEFYKNTGKLKKWKWAELEGDFSLVNRIAEAYSIFDDIAKVISKDRDKIQDQIDNGDLIDKLLSSLLSSGTTTRKEFAKDYHEDTFKDEETFMDEEVPSTIKTEIANIMQNNKLLDGIRKSSTAIDKTYSDLLKSIDKTIDDYAKHISSKGKDADSSAAVNYTRSGKSEKDPGTKGSATISGSDSSDAMTKLGTFRSAISVYQQSANMGTAACMNSAKFHIKQCRRLFGQIVSMRAAKNEAVLLDAIGESIEYDIDSSFEDYEI